MFRAIGRYFRAVGYLFTGRVDKARQTLSANPYVIQATFDNIVREKTKRIGQYKDAVATMIAQEEKKLATLKSLTEEVNRLERLKEGAAAKAKSVVEQLKAKGVSMDAIKKDENYLKCLAAFNDFSSTLTEKNSRIEELEVDVKDLSGKISSHKIQLQHLLREIEKVKEEATATVADVLTAKEEEAIASMIAGISEDSASKELQEMRDLRTQQKAKARMSSELAGTDTKRQEAEFLEYARGTAATDEFDQLIGLAKQTDASQKQSEEKVSARLPE